MNVTVTAIATLDHESVIPVALERKLRRADAFIRLGVAVVHDLLADRAPIDGQQAGRWGLIVGTGYGPMETNFDVLDQIVNDEQTSPTLFSHSVFNGAAGYLTRIFNIRGITATLTDFYYPFFQALDQGQLLIQSGRLDHCLVLQIETYSRLLQDARLDAAADRLDWPPCAVAWLLEADESSGRNPALHSLSIRTTAARENNSLSLKDIITLNGAEQETVHPMTAPLLVSRTLHDQEAARHHLLVTGNHGSIDLLMTP